MTQKLSAHLFQRAVLLTYLQRQEQSSFGSSINKTSSGRLLDSYSRRPLLEIIKRPFVTTSSITDIFTKAWTKLFWIISLLIKHCVERLLDSYLRPPWLETIKFALVTTSSKPFCTTEKPSSDTLVKRLPVRQRDNFFVTADTFSFSTVPTWRLVYCACSQIVMMASLLYAILLIVR